MVFTGDVALPFAGAIKCDFPDLFYNQKWILNLEGALVNDSSNYLESNLVVNQLDAIREVILDKDVIFALNNNHILDNGDFNETLINLKSLNKKFFGAGMNYFEASKPLALEDKGNEFIIIGYGWSIVECPTAGKNNPGVSELYSKKIFKDLENLKRDCPDKKICISLHWDYELEEFPMPSQRTLAMQLIDAGAELIIGAHPHRVQGIEMYKEKPIVYSLGNWMFRQGTYRNGNMNFPEFCNLQLAFEYDNAGDHKCHFFNYNKELHSIEYLRTESLSQSITIIKYTPFSGLSEKEYSKWFKKNRYHKRLIPVYKSDDSLIETYCKNLWNRTRTSLINLLVNLQFKS